MDAGGLRGDEEFLGDVAVGATGHEEAQDLAFAAGEAEGFGGAGGGVRLRRGGGAGAEGEAGAAGEEVDGVGEWTGAQAAGGGAGGAEEFGGLGPAGAGPGAGVGEEGLGVTEGDAGKVPGAFQGQEPLVGVGPVLDGVPSLATPEFGPDPGGLGLADGHEGDEVLGEVADEGYVVGTAFLRAGQAAGVGLDGGAATSRGQA